ncbi:MAG TPA: TonB-dependent receptor [Caulobacteraceae bacterium]|jgi:iron complex outermembrane receptor protein|nr:TonB-dependent receptor [Caulobacteraceae bacterium]
MRLKSNSVSRTAMLGCCSIIAMVGAGRVQAAEAAGAAAPTQAAGQAAAGQPGQLEEVVVTAQRTEQKLQKVPVAETAFTHAALEKHGITNVEDVQFHVPDINVREESDNGGLSIGIRGINVSAENFAYDSAVGVYVNSVFIARGNDFNATFFDVDSVQVLRGPQGTLFGRDTPAGAVLVDTRRPGSSYGGYLDANIGAGGDGLGAGANRTIYRFEGAVDLPVASDLNVRIAGYHINDSGYAESSVSGYRNYSKDDAGVRATAVYTPIDKFSATLILDYNHKNDGAPLFVPVGLTGPLSTPASDALNGGQAAANALIAAAKHPTPYVGQSNSPGQGIVGQTYSATLLMDYHLNDNWNLRSITGYRSMKNSALTDAFSIPFPFNTSTDDIQQSQVTQELVLDGDLFKNFHVLGGLYYFDETGFEQNLVNAVVQTGLTPFPPIPHPPFPFLDPLLLRGQNIDNSSKAVFFNGNYKILPNLTITGGVRYSEERKSLDVDSFFTVSGIPLAIGPQKFSGSVPVYDAKLTWQATHDLLLYASYGTGYRAGGIGFRAANSEFQPETSYTYEVGAKWDFDIGSMPARLNTALFDTEYKNFQVDVVLINPTRETIVNAGSATIRGAEFEFSIKPIQGLDISTSLGLLDAYYDSFILDNITLGGLINLTHNALRDAPTASLSISAGYTVPTSIGDWVYTVDYAYSSAYETDTEFQSNAPPAAQTDAFRQSPTNIVNARITLAKAFGSTWDVSVWGKNLTDQERLVYTLPNNGVDLAAFGEPRSLGVEVRTRF